MAASDRFAFGRAASMAPHLFSGLVIQAAAGATASAGKAAASVSVAIIRILGLLHLQRRGFAAVAVAFGAVRWAANAGERQQGQGGRPEQRCFRVDMRSSPLLTVLLRS